MTWHVVIVQILLFCRGPALAGSGVPSGGRRQRLREIEKETFRQWGHRARSPGGK